MRKLPLLLAAFLAASLCAVAADVERLFFSRDQLGGAPPYFDVTVDVDGHVVYRTSTDDELPVEFEAPSSDISRLFEMSEQLEYFAVPLSPAKRTPPQSGDKTLRHTTADGTTHEVQFVYSPDERVQELVVWFSKVAETESQFIDLERSLQFDRLGVNKVVLRLHAEFNKGRVVAPRQFLPLLEKVSKDLKILHLARSRAAGLIEQIEAQSATDE